MKTTLTLAIAAVATSLAASPLMAKDAMHHADKKAVKMQKKAGMQARMQVRQQDDANARYERSDRPAEYDRPYVSTYYDRGYNSGFWPADVAGGIVGGAIGAAGAIASAPFRDTYAAYDEPVVGATVTSGWNDNYYNSGWTNDWNSNWARRQSVEEGGFACTPGSFYTNSYGKTVLCQ